MHHQQQNEHVSLSTLSIESGVGAMENSNEALEQRLHEVVRKREQLQQAEVELRAEFMARSEVHCIQNRFEEQTKQHAEIVASLQVVSIPVHTYCPLSRECKIPLNL